MIIVIKRTVGENEFTGFDIVTTRVVLNAQPGQSCNNMDFLVVGTIPKRNKSKSNLNSSRPAALLLLESTCVFDSN